MSLPWLPGGGGGSQFPGGRRMCSRARPAPPSVPQPPQAPVNPALVVLHGHQSCLIPQTGGFRAQGLGPLEDQGGHECTVDTPACQTGAPWEETHMASPGSATPSPCPWNLDLAAWVSVPSQSAGPGGIVGSGGACLSG